MNYKDNVPYTEMMVKFGAANQLLNLLEYKHDDTMFKGLLVGLDGLTVDLGKDYDNTNIHYVDIDRWLYHITYDRLLRLYTNRR